MAPVEALVTPSLQKAITAAERLNAAFARKHPGDKPPLGDGLPWQGTADYAPQCRADHVVSGTDAARVTISYSFPGQPDADFTDVLRLSRVSDPALGRSGLAHRRRFLRRWLRHAQRHGRRLPIAGDRPARLS